MKIVLFGIPDMGSVCLSGLLEAGIKIQAVVPPVPTHSAHKTMVSLAAQAGIPVIFFQKKPSEEKFLDALRALEPDLAVVCSFDHLLPPELLSIPKMGVLNCHPSLLPAYRGANPYFHVIANNEKKTGITLHYMDEKFDTGDIVVQKEIALYNNETIGTLFNRLNYDTKDLLVETMKKIVSGQVLKRTPQPKSGHYPESPKVLPEKGHTLIDWSQSADAVERFVRACNPVYGATTFFRTHSVKIWSGRYDLNYEANNAPGTVIFTDSGNFAVCTGQGVFYPLSLQIGYYLITDVFDFISRVNPQTGELFSSYIFSG